MFYNTTKKNYSWASFSSTELLKDENLLQTYSLYEIDQICKNNGLSDVSFIYQDVLLKQLYLYDQSEEVNSFIYKGNKYWLDKEQRSCLRTVSEGNLQEIEFVIGDTSVKFSKDFIKEFIIQLETYAYLCFVNTEKHKQNIKQLQTEEELFNYNYKDGYPNKLILE